ncbi:MAG: hypothetical protein H6999_01320 [Hahellaceae bacterium]|nr:hypothetical protein [Hahellaceae bacterium]MCP5168392.1 hypothetical protein [Hahellaceae bacterium]
MKWIHSIVLGMLCYGTLSSGGSASAEELLDAEPLSELAQRADCSHISTTRPEALQVCGWIDAYKRGERVPEEDFLAQGRYIGKGFRVYANGKIESLLMAVGYRLTKNFHKKIYYPNQLCSLYVVPTSPRE